MARATQESDGSRSRRLQTLISIIDEKKDPRDREKKRLKVDPSISNESEDCEIGHDPEQR